MRSMFAIYLYEDPEGNVAIRADSYGTGEKVFNLGLDILEELNDLNRASGGEMFFMLPIQRCECVQ